MDNGYSLVNTPHIGKSVLWETSGHLNHYKENMFPPIVHEENDETYYLKPMNCPFHILIYKSDLHSYKELPLRYFEFGSVYRYENTCNNINNIDAFNYFSKNCVIIRKWVINMHNKKLTTVCIWASIGHS